MAATTDNPESIVWTDEETDYLNAVMTWGSNPNDADRRRRRVRRDAGVKQQLANPKPPVGEFRILVIGAKGTGKTSILTRVRHPRLL
jgi:hypothetical protein